MRFALLALLLASPFAVRAGDEPSFHPFLTVSAGIGFAQDDASVSAGGLATADLKGVAGMGPAIGASLGLDLRCGDLLAGVRVGWVRSWLAQSLDAALVTGESLRAEGSLDQNLLALARIGWSVSSVPIYLTGGWVWSWVSTSLAVHDLPTVTEGLHQDGPAVGLGLQPALSEHWFLEFEYLVVLYRTVPLSTPAGTALDVQVRSIASTFTVSGGWRF